jgi:uncharacterized membrane protein YraQ (UPF0718 family)
MYNLFMDITGGVLSNVLQLAIGCLLSILVYRLFRRKQPDKKIPLVTGYLLIAVFSLCGIVLPLGIYGAVPIITALLAVGFRFYMVLPLLISNVMFNMLVPFNDPAFIWKTGIRQVVFAFIAGIIAGIVLMVLKINWEEMFRFKNMPILQDKPVRLKAVFQIIDKYIKILAIYILIGVIVDIVFRSYVLQSMINVIFTNPYTSSIPGFFASHDVSNPFFLLTFRIAYMLMDFQKLSVLIAVSRPKGLIMYLGYYLTLAVILAIPAFI